MRTTVDLPEPLYQAIVVRAAQQGVPVDEAVRELIEEGLARHEEQEKPLKHPVITTNPRTGLPLIECDPAPAGQELTPERIADILLEQEVEWYQAATRHDAHRQ